MAGLIPQSFINDLLTRVDIVDVIDTRLTLKKAGKNYQALCPFHNEKSPSFSVSPEKQFYHCFGCGASGTALTFLLEFDRLDFVEAVETLARVAGVEVPREAGGGRPQNDHGNLYAVLEQAQRFFRGALKEAPEGVAYLKRRGLSGEVARDFGIGYAPEAWDALRKALKDVPEEQLLEAGLLIRNDNGKVYDRFRGRVMFPIKDTRGRIIGFGGRILEAGDHGPKYLNSPETPVFHKGRELYGLYEARRALRRLDRLVVVEGYMDVVALAQAGIANAVATLGTSATPDHFRKLYRHTEEVVCCFDGDNAGRQAAWRALESALPELGEGRQLKFMFLPDGEDPDSLVRAKGQAEFLRLSAHAEPAIEYLFGQLSQGLDLANLDDQARLASLAMPHIDRVPEGILKQLMQNRLRTLTGFDPARSRRGVATAAGPRSARPVSSEAAAQAPALPSAGGPAGASPGRSSSRGPGRQPLPPLALRLLGLLLQRPRILLSLAPEARCELSELADQNLLVHAVRYVDQNPDADTAEILGRWSGTAEHAILAGLVARPAALQENAMQAEFSEGVSRYLDLCRRADRQRVLAELRQERSQEKFLEYWSLKRDSSELDRS
jgi:DNA primase